MNEKQYFNKSTEQIMLLFDFSDPSMQTQLQNVKFIDLIHSSIILNSSNGFHSSIQAFSSAIISHNNLQSETIGQHYLLTIKYDLIQFSPLTPLKPEVTIFQFQVPAYFQVKSDLKISKLFQLDSLSYFIEIQTVLINEKSSQTGYATVKTQNFTNYLKHHVEVNFPSKQPLISQDPCQCSLSLGKKLEKNDNEWSFAIQNFQVISRSTENEPVFANQQQKPIIKNLSFPQDYSYPLIDKLQLPFSSQKISLQLKISQLPPYSSPKISQKSSQQFYICHDMKGGYFQDVNTFTPFRPNNEVYQYRFNYLSQTKIFNYFSHYPITIPPQMWRQLCKKYNVLCLGTFIVEPNDQAMDQNDFLTEQFALKLIYIAKKAKFDGYLINIEVPIQNPVRLVAWLDFLTKQINQAISGSQIVWYDSVVINGQLAYQNELNPYNKAFYQVSNGIFTNYWWKQQSLIHCLKHKIPSKAVYIGNDCFGRNTYGGGKYQIMNAVKTIQQIGKGQLTPALFAPGYTYQDQAENIIQKFHQNEIKMYHGSTIDQRKIQKWKLTQNGGQGWKKQNNWFVTSYDICKRQALIKICQYKGNHGALTIKFSCVVAGTGPKYPDYFKIALQVIDYKTNVVLLECVCPKNAAGQKQEFIEIKMEIDCSLITDNVCARILQEGKDVEHWAGNYGSRFKDETVGLIISSDERKWISSIPVSPIFLDGKYTTYFNNGEGDNFYLMGKKVSPKYSSLSDFDLPPVLTLNNISTVEITHTDAYLGGTCLKFENTDRIRLNSFYLLSGQRNFTVIVVTKATVPLEMICGGVKGQFKQYADSSSKLQNGWKCYMTEIVFQNQECNFIGQVRLSTTKGYVGEVSIFRQDNKPEKKQSNVLQLKINLNKQSEPLIPYHFDFLVQSSYSAIRPNPISRVLLKFGNFCGFINLFVTAQKKGKQTQYQVLGLLKKIPVSHNKGQEVLLNLFDVSDKVPKPIKQKLVSSNQLKQFLHNKPLSIDIQI